MVDAVDQLRSFGQRPACTVSDQPSPVLESPVPLYFLPLFRLKAGLFVALARRGAAKLKAPRPCCSGLNSNSLLVSDMYAMPAVAVQPAQIPGAGLFLLHPLLFARHVPFCSLVAKEALVARAGCLGSTYPTSSHESEWKKVSFLR